MQALSAIQSAALERDYYLWHAALADLARQTGDFDTARSSLQRAWELAPTHAEKELICRKITACLRLQRWIERSRIDVKRISRCW